MKRFKILFCLLATWSVVMGIGLGVDASVQHIHDFRVHEKVLYNVRSGPTHSYIAGYDQDPLTGVRTPVYGECRTATFQYRGTKVCECGATNGFYYYPDETHHSDCGQ